jgi:uncharacterized tellurite resistance protein B-like protein
MSIKSTESALIMAKTARKDLIMTLAKALIAAAWSDGEITLDEQNCLKELLFRLRQLTARDWASLEIYMAAPLEAEERLGIIDALRSAIRSPADKRLAKQALEQMISDCDGSLDAQSGIVAEILEAIEKTHVDPLSHLGKALQAPLREQIIRSRQVTKREQELEEFMRNRITFHFRRHLNQSTTNDHQDEDIQLWSAAGGLLARIAHADKEISSEERSAISAAMQTHWNLSPPILDALVDIALDEISNGLDFYRLTRQFYQLSSRQTREAFVASLYSIANADGEISFIENEEIRNIARGLKLTHRQMISAKKSVLDAS